MSKDLELAKLIKDILDELKEEERDLFLYSGGIDQESVNTLFSILTTKQEKHKNVSLILTTWGGDAHQAYRIARLIQNNYSVFRVVVAGPCKSAGTLVAVGAHELAFDLLGELGPLDVQLTKSDEIIGTKSGLDTLQTLFIMRNEAFSAFEKYMVDLIRKSTGTISTKTASDVATQLVIGLFQPVIQRIDPHRLSEVERMMKIAMEYGKRLGMPNLKQDEESQLDHLIQGYPSHRFIIDKEEASTIFKTVLDASQLERKVITFFLNFVKTPSQDPVIIDVGTHLQNIFTRIDGEEILKSNEEKKGNGIAEEQIGENNQRASGEAHGASREGTPRNQ